MNYSSYPSGMTTMNCRKCGHPGSDLRLLGCGCVLHARCTPLSLVVAEKPPSALDFGGIPAPVKARNVPCPICFKGLVSGIQLFPLSFVDLERAVELRKQCAKAAVPVNSTTAQGDLSNRKRSRESEDDEEMFHQVQAESSYLLLSHARTSLGAGTSDTHNHRTGRWTSEEIAFVDHMVSAFERGTLPLPHGVKLNDFLGDMLLCKSSRLTKKMKNAKLSTRSYTLKSPMMTMPSHCCGTLSTLQEHFLLSVPSEPTQLELRFNMTKLWRTHFSNLCLQVGYEMLDARDWLSSLEGMERRASDAEEHIRKARRRRMGLALKKDIGERANPGVFIGGVPARDANMHPPLARTGSLPVTTMSSLPTSIVPAPTRSASEVISSDSEKQDDDDDEDNDEFLAALELTAADGPSHQRTFSEDYFHGFDDLIDPLSIETHMTDLPSSLGDCGSFLEEIITYMEAKKLPFQHVDVWVPSFVGPEGNSTGGNGTKEGETIRLLHAGQATRSDLTPTLSSQMNEYGEYSTHFSFVPGHGLPGRVYVTGKASWEKGIHNADPKIFERSGGAKVYGIKTAVGIPLESAAIGRIIVVMYSTAEMDEDPVLLKKYVEDFSQWTPEPKWKLVIDLGMPPSTESFAMKKEHTTTSMVQTAGMVHYTHNKRPESIPTPIANMSTPSPTMSAQPNPVGGSHAFVPYGTVKNTETVESMTTLKCSDDDEEEQRIASLLGDHMPVNGGHTASTPLLPHFMSLRLLLLRSPGRRSPEEKELISIVKKSFRGYTKDNKRGGAELAYLIAKDWMYLNPTAISSNNSPKSGPLQSPQLQHQCHIMSAPTSTLTSTGAPPTMPSPLVPYPSHMSSANMLGSQQHVLSFSSMSSMGSEYGNNSARLNTYDNNKSDMGFSRRRSVSASSESSPSHLADIVPDS